LRTVLFFRNYKAFHGGHLKVWNYFNHVLASPVFEPRVWFSEQTTLDSQNPWRDSQDLVVDRQHPIRPAVSFVGGAHWRLLDRYPYADPSIPVINLVQHVRHADPERRLAKYLHRKAIRICVSQEVADELRATGLTIGPLIVIPNAIDLSDLPSRNGAIEKVDVLIAAGKEPDLGVEIADRLAQEGRVVDLLVERIPRPEFLSRMRAAYTTVYLPHETEGFFLPALEGMALGTIVVCPDCIGNRSFCLPGHNAFRPNYVVDDVIRDAEAALALHPEQARQLRENARRTAEEHSLERERDAFLEILHNIDELWEGMNAVTTPEESDYGTVSAGSRGPRR
jgi:glycosyltransferase involved in cell wall biosynthesis